jgi:hypothetical protein
MGSITNAISPVRIKGNQPPSNSFNEFAERKMRSTIRKEPLTAMTRIGLKPH